MRRMLAGCCGPLCDLRIRCFFSSTRSFIASRITAARTQARKNGWAGWNSAVFGYLGRVSYGLYVFHVAAIRLTESLGVGAAFLLTVAAAAVSYRYLETPFLRLKDRFARA